MTKEDRDNLIQKAIADLIKVVPESTPYGRTPKTKLQDAFDQAVFHTTREMAKDIIAEDPSIRERIKGVFMHAIDKALTPGSPTYDKLIEGMSDKVTQFLQGELKDRY